MTYHQGSRALQDAFDTRQLADRLRERKVRDRFSAEDRATIERDGPLPSRAPGLR